MICIVTSYVKRPEGEAKTALGGHAILENRLIEFEKDSSWFDLLGIELDKLEKRYPREDGWSDHAVRIDEFDLRVSGLQMSRRVKGSSTAEE